MPARTIWGITNRMLHSPKDISELDAIAFPLSEKNKKSEWYNSEQLLSSAAGMEQKTMIML